jgi:hypothetical protein
MFWTECETKDTQKGSVKSNRSIERNAFYSFEFVVEIAPYNTDPRCAAMSYPLIGRLSTARPIFDCEARILETR